MMSDECFAKKLVNAPKEQNTLSPRHAMGTGCMKGFCPFVPSSISLPFLFYR